MHTEGGPWTTLRPAADVVQRIAVLCMLIRALPCAGRCWRAAVHIGSVRRLRAVCKAGRCGTSVVRAGDGAAG